MRCLSVSVYAMSTPSPKFPVRKTERLRRGRLSIPEAVYFLNICTRPRAPVLLREENIPCLRAAFDAITGDDAEMLAATIMPDHVHLLFRLGRRLVFDRVMAKFKALARGSGRKSWHWQENGFERRLRPDDLAEHYAFYIFMNPYQAGLIPMTEAWPFWICPEPRRFVFPEYIDEKGIPPPEWLVEIEKLTPRLSVGE
jgi:REP element-mobilizing transposase RayT